MISIVGKTTDGKMVVDGVYNFYSTYGLPMDILLDSLWKKNYVPSWECFVKEAKQNGVNLSRLLKKISVSILDVYGKNAHKNIMEYIDNSDNQTRISEI
ncbi:MAG: hypothetical protein KAS32_29795 [Candidatus Peribacteraceae bacterium]|nr:hypothetical protein [Candidatus Peribacteraceae bacterium]